MSEQMSEHELREDLAAAFRMLDRHGMSDLTNGSVVARLPGADWYLTHPHGKHFHEMCASDFVAVNIDGTPVNPGDVVNLAVTRPAKAIFAARPEVNAVIHAHGQGIMGVAALSCGLLPLCEAAMPFYEDVGYIRGDFYFDDDYIAEIAEKLGPHKALIYRHHAFAVVGTTIPEAFYFAFQLNVACEVQLKVMACGSEFMNVPPPEEARAHRDAFFADGWVADGSMEWPGLRRQLDAEGSNYKA